MNDRELEKRVHAAFDAVEVPASVRQATIATLDRQREDVALSGEGAAANTDARDGKRASAARIVRPRRWGRFASAVAACLVLGAVLVGVVRAGAEPTAFVDIDVNPSIELQINRFDKVVGVRGVNADGEEVVKGLALAGLSYAEALTVLTESDAMAPYLGADAYVQVSVSSDDQRQEQALTDLSEQCIAALPCRGSCDAVSLQVHEEAHSHGMGCGRYAAALRLIELDPSVTIEDCAGLSMREMRERIAAAGGTTEDLAPSGSQGSGPHHGQRRHQLRSA